MKRTMVRILFCVVLLLFVTGCMLLNPNRSPEAGIIGSHNGTFVTYAGNTFSVEGTSTDPDGDDLTYCWETGSTKLSGLGNPKSFKCVYDVPGEYRVKLTVDDGELSDTVECIVRVKYHPCTASSVSPELSVVFDNSRYGRGLVSSSRLTAEIDDTVTFHFFSFDPDDDQDTQRSNIRIQSMIAIRTAEIVSEVSGIVNCGIIIEKLTNDGWERIKLIDSGDNLGFSLDHPTFLWKPQENGIYRFTFHVRDNDDCPNQGAVFLKQIIEVSECPECQDMNNWGKEKSFFAPLIF